ncbi:MAG: hypothetical protein IPM57_10075 [Oligoflexia bacterium]|nr:hypothetical protein [Oligoflexia bacterium]
MNIKLDKDVRIRLNQEDLINWKACKHLVQDFKFGTLNFNLKINLDPDIKKSCVNCENGNMAISLNSEDTSKLCLNQLHSAGITIEDINIQVDHWSIQKRDKYNESVKAKKV